MWPSLLLHVCGETNVRQPLKHMKRTIKILSVSYDVITKCARG